MINKYITVMILFIFSIGATTFLPKQNYESLGVLKSINLPANLKRWRSKDVSSQIDIDKGNSKFIGDIFARFYVNESGEELLFSVIDAGNFHNPKVCYASCGFEAQDLEDINLKFSGKKIRAPTVLLKNGSRCYLLIYWLCLDKEIVSWKKQKIIELWKSILNKKKTGFMVRLDILILENNVEQAIEIARLFFYDVYSMIPPKEAEYIFGK